jgi:hypothetical protein
VGWAFGMAKYRHHWWLPRTLAAVPLAGEWLAPSWEGMEDRAAALVIDDLARRPKVQWMTFGSLDGHQHVNGTDARYVELVRHADRVIGRYREASRRLGLERDRLYALVSDHGVADARVNVDLRAALRECCGLRAERDRATRIFTATCSTSSTSAIRPPRRRRRGRARWAAPSSPPTARAAWTSSRACAARAGSRW